MAKNDYSAPKATALNGSSEGNDAQVERTGSTENVILGPMALHGVRLTNLEKALSSLDTLFVGLQGSVIHLEKRIDSLEDSPVAKQRLLSRIDQAEKRIVKIEDDIMYLRPLSETPGVSEYRKIKELESQVVAVARENRELQSVKVELAKFKAAMAAFSNHIHLPDGRLGMPFTLKG